jgi:hypothetical protein
MATAICTAGAVATGAGSTTLPTQALVGSATARLQLLELAITNTTATSCIYKLQRLTAAGTPGTALTSAQSDPADGTPTGAVRQVYTGTAPTLGADLGYRFVVPAAIGAGVIRTFENLIIPLAAAAAIALLVDSGTGQLCAIDWTWKEI